MRKRKGMAVIAAIVMTAVMSLGGSLAATTTVGISDGAAAVTVNQTIVGFAGHEWWVIGDASSGVYPQKNSVTLLAKGDFGSTEFRKISAIEQEGYKKYGIYWYEGTFKEYPNEYKDSTLQRKMENIANNFSDKEKGKINDRTITSKGESYPIAGADVANQKLWPLSGDEYIAIGIDNVRSYGKDNWLRSYSPDYHDLACSAPAVGGSPINSIRVYYYMAARPALNLNVADVMFTLNAGQTGKAAATPGGGLVSVTAPDTTGDGNKIKYTFKDDSLKLGNVSVSKIEKNTVTVKYAGATEDKNLSLIVKNSKGTVTHYGKLAENIMPESEASFTLPDGFDTTKNKVEVFVEEIGKDDNHSDFASTPKALNINTVTVNGGTGGGPHAPGTEVTLKAAPAAAGQRFKHWEISPEVTPTQDISFENETITFTMPDEAVTATAVYEYSLTVIGGSGSNYYTEGEEVTITANQPAEGKYFKGWNISPEVTLTEGTNTSSIIKFDMPAHAVTATAEYEDLVVYPIKDSDNTGWTQGDQGGLTITSEGEHRKFTDVSVDGAVLDRQHYTVESGSTIVTLKVSYLSTLSVGQHVMRIHFTDGYTETKFSIQAEQTDKPAPPTTDPTEPNPPVNPGEPTTPVNPPVQPGEPNPPVQGGTTTATTVAPVGTSPKTGDSNMIWIMVSLMLGAGVGFMAVSAFKKSKQI